MIELNIPIDVYALNSVGLGRQISRAEKGQKGKVPCSGELAVSVD